MIASSCWMADAAVLAEISATISATRQLRLLSDVRPREDNVGHPAASAGCKAEKTIKEA